MKWLVLLLLISAVAENNPQPATVEAVPVKACQCHFVDTLFFSSEAELNTWPQKCLFNPSCLPFQPDFSKETMVGVSLFSDCLAQHTFDAQWKHDIKKLEVTVQVKEGLCRNMRQFDYWLRLPRLPEGYKVGVSQNRQ